MTCATGLVMARLAWPDATATEPTGSSERVASTLPPTTAGTCIPHRQINERHVLIGIETRRSHHMTGDGSPLNARHMAKLLAPEIGETLDVAVGFDDQPVIDQADLDPSPLQAEDLKRSRKLRFREHRDARRGAGRAEIRPRADHASMI